MKVKMKCIRSTKDPSGQYLLEFKPESLSMINGENKTLYVLERDEIEVGKIYTGYVVCDMFIPVSLIKV